MVVGEEVWVGEEELGCLAHHEFGLSCKNFSRLPQIAVVACTGL